MSCLHHRAYQHTTAHLALLINVCDPLDAAGQEAVLVIQRLHGSIPSEQLPIAQLWRISKAPLPPAHKAVHANVVGCVRLQPPAVWELESCVQLADVYRIHAVADSRWRLLQNYQPASDNCGMRFAVPAVSMAPVVAFAWEVNPFKVSKLIACNARAMLCLPSQQQQCGPSMRQIAHNNT